MIFWVSVHEANSNWRAMYKYKKGEKRKLHTLSLACFYFNNVQKQQDLISLKNKKIYYMFSHWTSLVLILNKHIQVVFVLLFYPSHSLCLM